MVRVAGVEVAPWLVMAGHGSNTPNFTGKYPTEAQVNSRKKTKATRPYTSCLNSLCPGVATRQAWTYTDLPILQMECKFCHEPFVHTKPPFEGQKVCMGSLKEGPGEGQPMGIKKKGSSLVVNPYRQHAGQRRWGGYYEPPRGDGEATQERPEAGKPSDESGPMGPSSSQAGTGSSVGPSLPQSLKGTRNAIKHNHEQVNIAMDQMHKCEVSLKEAAAKADAIVAHLDVLHNLEASQESAQHVAEHPSSSSEDDDDADPSAVFTKKEMAKVV